jgi:glutathione peroxidase
MTVYEIPIQTLEGEPATLEVYRGQVLLIVNVASRCGFTPQYESLEALYRRHRDQGFSVLGFPCDQFAHQEPGTAAEIRDFCTRVYDVTFPLFAKIDVNGRNTHPLYTFLKRAQHGFLGTRAIKWNFTKFLVGRDGRVLRRYAPNSRPEDIEADLARTLS